MTEISPELRDSVERALSLPTTELWLTLGQQLKETDELKIAYSILGRRTDLSPDDVTVLEAKQWFTLATKRLRGKICVEFNYCAKKKTFSFANRIELIGAVAGVLEGTVAQTISAVALAAILTRQGLDSFCGCDTALDYIRRASAQDQGSPAAIALLNRAIAENPLSFMAYYNLGLAYDVSDDHRQAEVNYRKAIEINRDDWYALNNLSYLFLRIGINVRETLDLSERALALRPDQIAIIHTHGLALLRNNRFQEAIPYLQRAVDDEPNDERRCHLREAMEAVSSQIQKPLTVRHGKKRKSVH